MTTLQQLKDDSTVLANFEIAKIIIKSQKATDKKASSNFIIWKLAYQKAIAQGNDIANLKEFLTVDVKRSTVNNVLGAIATGITNGLDVDKFESANALMKANQKVAKKSHLVDAKGELVLDKEKKATEKQEKDDKVENSKNIATTTRAKTWYKNLVKNATEDGIDVIELYKLLKVDLAKK